MMRTSPDTKGKLLPESPSAQQLVLDVFKARTLAPESSTQETLAHLDRTTEARQRQLDSE